MDDEELKIWNDEIINNHRISQKINDGNINYHIFVPGFINQRPCYRLFGEDYMDFDYYFDGEKWVCSIDNNLENDLRFPKVNLLNNNLHNLFIDFFNKIKEILNI